MTGVFLWVLINTKNGFIPAAFSEKRGDDTGSIVGGTIGSLTVIIITALMLGVTIILVHRQKHRKQQVNEQGKCKSFKYYI